MPMRFHNVFDDVLGNKTKVKLLRAFFTYPDKKFSESDLQRIAGIPQASVHRNIKSLLESGLLERQRVGKTNLYSVNREHVLYELLSKIFDGERNLKKELKKVVKEAVKNLPEVELVILFGSIAKGTERADSDVDIFVVCRGDKSQVEEELGDVATTIESRFGNPVSLMVKHVEALEELKTRPIYNEIKSGEIIFKREGFEW